MSGKMHRFTLHPQKTSLKDRFIIAYRMLFGLTIVIEGSLWDDAGEEQRVVRLADLERARPQHSIRDWKPESD